VGGPRGVTQGCRPPRMPRIKGTVDVISSDPLIRKCRTMSEQQCFPLTLRLNQKEKNILFFFYLKTDHFLWRISAAWREGMKLTE